MPLDLDRLLLEDEEAIVARRMAAMARERTKQASPGHPLAVYLHDPVGWGKVALPDVTLAPYQEEALRQLVANKRHAVRGPHGLGKSFISAYVILWFATTSEAAGLSWKVGSTASAWRQLTKFLWPEIRALARQLDWEAIGLVPWVRHEQLLDLSIKLEYGEAFAAASDVPENMEGLHAQRVLYVYDESKTIGDETWEATEGAFSTAGGDTGDEAYALAVSTPGAPAGVFHSIHKRRPGYEDWSKQHVTLAMAVAAGRISQEWADQRAKQWGSKSAVYRNRVLGEFAADDERSMIPLSFVEAAVERWHVWQESQADVAGPMVPSRLGVDVARHGSDKTVIASIHGQVVSHLDVRDHTDNVVTLADEVAQIATGGAHVVVDADGMGAGTADRLRQVIGPDRVTVFHGAPRPDWWRDRSGELEAFNTRAAAWYSFRERLDPAFGPTVCLPPDDEMIGDLTGPERVYDSAGARIKLEPKKTTAARLGRSPDRADAVVMGFWIEHVPPPPEAWTPDEAFMSPEPSGWSQPDLPTVPHGGRF